MPRAHLLRRALWLIAAASVLPARADAQPIVSEYVEGEGHDKALELWNPTDRDIDLGEVVVEVHFNGAPEPGRRIALAGVLAPGDVVVVAHADAAATLLARADLVVSGALFDGDDAVVVRAAGLVADAIGQVGLDPGTAWGAGLVRTRDRALRRAPGAPRDVDPFDAFEPASGWFGVAPDDFGDLGAPPGWVPPPLAPGLHRIRDVQGRAHRSPMEGLFVEGLAGIVTAVRASGFEMQDPFPDDDPATSEALSVHAPGLVLPAVGDAVLVAGRVVEYRPGSATTSLTTTQVHALDVAVAPDLFGGATVTPERLGEGGRAIPSEVVDDDTHGNVEDPASTVFDPANDGLDFLESLESMWVVLPEARVVGPTNRFGEVWVVADDGRSATSINAAGGLTERADDANPEVFRLGDALARGAIPSLDVGARLGDVEGVLGYAFGAYEVRVFAPITGDGARLPDEGTTLVGDAWHVTVATWNVANLDPRVEDRARVASGADVDDDVGSGRVARLAAHVVDGLAAPDVVALQEVQDGDGAEDSGNTDASATYEALAAAIREAGGPDYAYADVAPEDGMDGGQPGGNIRPGFLYRRDRVALRRAPLGGGTARDVAELHRGVDGVFLAHNPVRLAPAEAADAARLVGTRKPVVAQFERLGAGGRPRRGSTFFVVNAHFASRAGSTPLQGPLQPPRVRGEDARRAQARAIARFAETLRGVAPAARLLVVGDLNAPGFAPEMELLAEAQLVDLASARLPPEERYSYVFEGRSQDLDHVLAPAWLAPHVELEIVHAHAEYAAPASDHDALVARLALGDRPARAPGRTGWLAAWLARWVAWLYELFTR